MAYRSPAGHVRWVQVCRRALPVAIATAIVLLLAVPAPSVKAVSTAPPEVLDFPTLRSGSQGPEVAWLEQRLADLSYRPGPVDGVFDRKTRQAVIAFQKWEGLTRDGTVGEAVWEALLSAVRPTPTRILSGTWIEVNKSKQVLLFCRSGTVERILPCSTGNPGIRCRRLAVLQV